MKKRRLKGFVVPVFSAILFSGLIITLLSLSNEPEIKTELNQQYTYVNDSIINKVIPTLNEDKIILKPFDSNKVTVYKKFYDSEQNKEDSIIYYNNTYMQNSGVLYNSDAEFNVLSVLDGDVIEVKKDNILGYVVEIKHDDNLISTYQGLKSINVKKNDKVTQGTVIGKSGEISLDVNLKNSLLFELIKEGKYVNPEKYYNKKIKEI